MDTSNSSKNAPSVSNKAENIGIIISHIEKSKQATALAQIEATKQNNIKEFELATMQENNKLEKWNKSFYIGTISSIIMITLSIYLIFNNDKDLGLGLLATTISGVFGFIAGSGNCSK